MLPWQGRRAIAVVTACVNANGAPDFALTTIAVTYEEYANGVHYELVEERLRDDDYEAPFVHFDAIEAPSFLHPAVRQYLGADSTARIANPITPQEES